MDSCNLYIHDCCIGVMRFPQTRPEDCCNLKHFLALEAQQRRKLFLEN